MESSPMSHDVSPPTTPNTADAFERAEETLRSLREDIIIFNDPVVQNYLETIPTTSPDIPEPVPGPPAELHAVTIALRTRLNDTIDSITRLKHSNNVARRRAARAEARSAELVRQLSEAVKSHKEIESVSNARIEELHRERLERAQLDEDRPGKELVDKADVQRMLMEVKHERDRALEEARVLQNRVGILERGIDATQEKNQVEVLGIIAERDAMVKRVHELESGMKENDASKESLQKVKEMELLKARQVTEALQLENTVLRDDIKIAETECRRTKEKLLRAEEDLQVLQIQLQKMKVDEEELEYSKEELILMGHKLRELGIVRSHLDALSQEKDELTKLISALSKTSDIQEGVCILKGLARNGGKVCSLEGLEAGLRINELEGRIIHMQEERDEEKRRLLREIEDVKKKHAEVRNRLALVSAAKTSEMNSVKRYIHLLRKETDLSNPVFEEIEKKLENLEGLYCQNGDSGGEQVQSGVIANQDMIAEYKASLEKMEKMLCSVQGELVSLKSKQPILMTDEGGELDSIVVDRLREELRSTKTKAESETRELENRLSEMETEMRKLKVNDDENVWGVKDGEADFDRSEIKVVHMEDNPLIKARQKYIAEAEKAKGKKRLRLDGEFESLSGNGSELKRQLQDCQKELEKVSKLNRELSETSKVGLRTKEIALKKIEEVRSVVYNLFGWSMKMKGAQYTLTSIYAESEEVLMFGLNEYGTMQMEITEYSCRLSEEIEQFVERMKSFPALLSHITMENFEKTTMVA